MSQPLYVTLMFMDGSERKVTMNYAPRQGEFIMLDGIKYEVLQITHIMPGNPTMWLCEKCTVNVRLVT